MYNQNEWVKFFVLNKNWAIYFESVQHFYILFYYFFIQVLHILILNVLSSGPISFSVPENQPTKIYLKINKI